MIASDKPVTIDPKAVGSIALGVAAGLVVADRMGRTSREVAALGLLSVGLVATVPFLTKYVKRQLNAPSHRFGSQKNAERHSPFGSYGFFHRVGARRRCPESDFRVVIFTIITKIICN